jgi:putative tricarboxylic transport membrane protein
MQSKNNNPNVIWSTLFLLLSGFVFYEATKMPYRADVVLPIRGNFFPIILACLLALLSILLFFEKNVVHGKTISKRAFKQLLFIIGGMVAYIELIDYIGFFVTAFLFMILTSQTLGKVRWLESVLVSAAVAAAVYVIFVIWLKVRFPVGIFDRLF